MTSENADRHQVPRAAFFGLLALVCVLFATCGIRTPREGWNERWGPLVPHKSFPGDCGICHVPERWDVLKDDFQFDHAKETGHPLEGAHATAACLRCHNDFGPVQAYTVRGCAGCHADIHQGQLTGECTLCHNESNWRPEGLVAEHARTRFPLYGAHLAAACEACHFRAPTGDFKSAPTECALCHTADLARATTPDHAAQGWTDTCERCHSPVAWGGGAFLHGFFPLEGGHDIECLDCHTSINFEPLPKTCITCHQDDRDRAPNHDGFATTCEDCHNIYTWEGARIDHSFFPLTGGHELECTACHTNGTFDGLSTACVSCHQDDYDNAPNHETFPTSCEDCHTINRWDDAQIDHSFFPLTGGHAIACADCHTNGIGDLPTTCISCHQDDFNNAPNHDNFGTNCEECHNINDWADADFRHNSFPLTGRHDVACTECHTTNNPPQFTCLECHAHNQNDMDNEHDDVRNYRYDSAACYNCHENGRG
jgi:hypothetical protein